MAALKVWELADNRPSKTQQLLQTHAVRMSAAEARPGVGVRHVRPAMFRRSLQIT